MRLTSLTLVTGTFSSRAISRIPRLSSSFVCKRILGMSVPTREGAMIQYQLDHIMSYTAKLTGPEMIGAVPDGIRANIYVTGGEVTGPKVGGKFCRLVAIGSPYVGRVLGFSTFALRLKLTMAD
jgi:hypothetical protein